MKERMKRKNFFTKLGVWSLGAFAIISSPLQLFGKEKNHTKRKMTVQPNPLAVKRQNTGV